MMSLKSMDCRGYLDIAQLYANRNSGCRKVAVGSIIVKDWRVLAMGANRAIPDLCKTPRGCFRVEVYGEDSKSHRNPEDCRAIHSEIDAICSAAATGNAVDESTIFVTRYPCEGCAKAIIAAGIKTVYYGGTAPISEQTAVMFEDFGVDCIHIFNWKEDTTDR